MLYKFGDKVKIKKREELEKCRIFVEAMLPYAEQIATITYVSDFGYYNISNDEGSFRWDDDCFCGRGLPDLPKEFEILEKFEREGWKAAPNKNYVDEKFEKGVEGIGPHGEEFTSTKAICNYIPASHIKTEPMFDILYERINKLEKRIEELERKVDILETLTMR